ncbi:uncharacterized protein N7482_007743 [Penicillium canariense]|uniref:Vps72/YL1 C-terminal domain-containing protein n=1 Tax=Penicillium canariense TaxID=189055 RepID=A0A9W9HXD3_9EURO|nr:uncharacterized protein N7482_007743 [Penicillium canariense]KAJ5160739.1 hypothetical protein N7482_007743 [Penicillium canariense]
MADIMDDQPSSGLQSSEDEGGKMPVESLVQGRAKRSTAGRHMSALIDAAADDDLTLLFEEVEDDNEFAMDAEAAEEDEMALDSSSDDDDDDHGPNAQNDYEGEKELQKEERKKRRAQNDLRFQTLRKRVKIDPTALSSVPAPPVRPKKKSERISWLPTVEDGPTRSSSRRQTMVNKELTHARLKDSQEKRIRIIATMKEAEKRKAHLKPKEMTQEDHLAEAARVERLNSKSLNRWELSEKRKAEERKAKIEALQNRRLEGPVLSYWSGVATWVNGRLTRVGKIDIKAKPEKEETRKKKKDKDEMTATESQGGQSATPAPVPPLNNAAPPGDASALAPALAPASVSGYLGPIPPSDQRPSENTTLQAASTPTPEQPSKPVENPSEQKAVDESPVNKMVPGDAEQQPASDFTEKEEVKAAEPEAPAPTSKPSKNHPIPVVEIIGPRRPSDSSAKEASEDKPAEVPSTDKREEKPDTMDLDPDLDSKTAADATKDDGPQPPIKQTSPQAGTTTSTGIHAAAGENSQTSLASSTAASVTEHVAPTDPKSPHAPQAQAPPADAAPLHATPPNITGVPNHGVYLSEQLGGGPLLQQSTQSQDAIPAPASTQPEIPPPPPVIEQTGRNLTILENFDDRTAHSKKFSMYFNAKKPPRLTSQHKQLTNQPTNQTEISSSLCVITSLPSRYRDPETSLPYANSYAYGQIRRMLSQGYIWSSMLGCFVGPGGVAARGVPDRFLGKETKPSAEDAEKKADPATQAAAGAGTAGGGASATDEAKSAPEPMDVDAT